MPVDNNWIENQIRPWALGRANWLFAGSLRSGKRSAAIMSLIQSDPWTCSRGCRRSGRGRSAMCYRINGRLPESRKVTWVAAYPEVALLSSSSFRLPEVILYVFKAHQLFVVEAAQALGGQDVYAEIFEFVAHSLKGFDAHQDCNGSVVFENHQVGLLPAGDALQICAKTSGHFRSRNCLLSSC